MVFFPFRPCHERASAQHFVSPVLEFVAQLCPITDAVQQSFGFALSKLAAGPGNWIVIGDALRLSSFGFHTDFRSIVHVARAAKLRVTRDIFNDLSSLKRRLDCAYSDCFRRPFEVWHYKSFVQVLDGNRAELHAMGITISCVDQVQGSTSADTRTTRSFQSLAYSLLVQPM